MCIGKVESPRFGATEGSSLTTCGFRCVRCPCFLRVGFTHCFWVCVNPNTSGSCRIMFVGFCSLSLTFVLICRVAEDVRSGQFVCRGCVFCSGRLWSVGVLRLAVAGASLRPLSLLRFVFCSVAMFHTRRGLIHKGVHACVVAWQMSGGFVVKKDVIFIEKSCIFCAFLLDILLKMLYNIYNENGRCSNTRRSLKLSITCRSSIANKTFFLLYAIDD